MLSWSFENRKEAGLMLAEKIDHHFDKSNAIILAIPRGGVPVGYHMAKKLGIPLDIILSKKIGHPLNPEFAIGSVSMESVVLDPHPEVSEEYIQNEITRIRQELKTKYQLYMGEKKPPELKGKIVIITDDGIATGNTLLATIEMLRKQNPQKIIVAIPVLPYEKTARFKKVADELIYLLAPEYFPGVGAFYRNFSQENDENVKQMLKEINDHKKDSITI